VKSYRHEVRRPGWYLALVGAGAIVLGAAACSSSSSPSAAGSPSAGTATAAGTASAGTAAGGSGQCPDIPSGPITIYNILPLTGVEATAGNLQQSTDEVAVAEFNKQETICGHSIQLQNLDDKGDPATALNLARQIVASGDDLMFNDSFGQTQDAIHPYLMAHHVIVYSNLSPSSIVGQPQNPTAFSTGPSNEQYAAAMMGYAKAHGENNVGILTDGTSFGNELTADTKAAALKDGLTVKATQTFSPTAVDLTTPLTQLRQAGVQTLVPAAESDLTVMASGLKQIGWSPAVVSWGGINSYGITAAQLPPNTVDLCYTHYTPSLLTGVNTAMMAAQQAKTGLNSIIEGVLLPYASILVYKHAIEAADSLDGAKVAAQIETLSNFATNIPGTNFTYTAANHWGYPQSSVAMCTLKPQKFALLTLAP
jgi:ABC-type branched-subunit amino acid transport system substrate-binding protein